MSMSSITMVDNEYMILQYLTDKRIVYHTCKKPVGGQILRDTLNIGTETLRQYKACKWLSDDRKNGPLSEEDIEWGFNDWNRRTIEAGWKYWAQIVPIAMRDAGTMIPMMESVHKMGLRLMVFVTLEEAIEWLDEMEE